MTNLTPFLYAWIALAGVVVCLALYRKFISLHEDNFIHLGDREARQISTQVEVFHRLEVVDRLGKALTMLTVAGGVALLAFSLYIGFMQNR